PPRTQPQRLVPDHQFALRAVGNVEGLLPGILTGTQFPSAQPGTPARIGPVGEHERATGALGADLAAQVALLGRHRGQVVAVTVLDPDARDVPVGSELVGADPPDHAGAAL